MSVGDRHTVGNRKFVEVPGERTHELPPLLVRMSPAVKRMDRVMEMAAELVQQEEILPPEPMNAIPQMAMDFERRKMDLAINLVEQYMEFRLHWGWGDDVLEWIRQCEVTFGHKQEPSQFIARGFVAAREPLELRDVAVRQGSGYAWGSGSRKRSGCG